MDEFKEMIGKKRAYEHKTDIEVIKDITRGWADMSVEQAYYIEYESGSRRGPFTKMEIEWVRDSNLLRKFKCGNIEVDAMDEDYAWEMILDIRMSQLSARGMKVTDATTQALEELKTIEEKGWS